MYYVEQKIYNDGTVETVVLNEEEAHAKGYYNGYYSRNETHEIIVDGDFGNKLAALDFAEDVKSKAD